MKQKSWNQLTKAEQKEIISQFKDWDLQKLQRAKWDKSPMRFGKKTYYNWSADFGTRLKLS